MIEIGKALDRELRAGVRPKRASIEATITRADGTVEHLGVIASTEFTLSGRIAAAFRKAFKWI